MTTPRMCPRSARKVIVACPPPWIVISTDLSVRCVECEVNVPSYTSCHCRWLYCRPERTHPLRPNGLTTSSQAPANTVDRENVTPFPGLHTSANEHADEHVAAARKLADDAEFWLAELDAVLSDGQSASAK